MPFLLHIGNTLIVSSERWNYLHHVAFLNYDFSFFLVGLFWDLSDAVWMSDMHTLKKEKKKDPFSKKKKRRKKTTKKEMETYLSDK